MKKVLVSFLILIFACVAVFADINITSPVTMNLKTELKPGSNPPGPENPGGDSGDDGQGLFYTIGLSKNNGELLLGSKLNSDDLNKLSGYSKENPYDGSDANVASLLVPDGEDEETDTYSIDIYLAVGTNISKDRTLSVKIYSDNGWTRQQEEGQTQSDAKSVPIYFKSDVLGSELNNMLYAESSAAEENATSETITVTAKGPANNDYTYLSRTTASWTRSRDYLAGTYEAEIKVEISAGNI